MPNSVSVIRPKEVDGVYVDCSQQDEEMILGFAIVKDGTHYQFSMMSKSRNTNEAEAEAICKAKKLFPGELVFCDYRIMADKFRAKFIDRSLNTLAHHAAKKRIGMYEVPKEMITFGIFKREMQKLRLTCRDNGHGVWIADFAKPEFNPETLHLPGTKCTVITFEYRPMEEGRTLKFLNQMRRKCSLAQVVKIISHTINS